MSTYLLDNQHFQSLGGEAAQASAEGRPRRASPWEGGGLDALNSLNAFRGAATQNFFSFFEQCRARRLTER